ncbi:putative iron-only hydrogenase system regulator [Lachnospiraceae bacterium XBB1006]|nr:putative iron-only hydrogenase system regulator [Lachnospiraceae bacterium XBB1006]
MEETRVAVLAIAVKDREKAMQVNEILHTYGQHIIARNGIPYQERGISIITVILDTTQDEVSTLSGKIGKLSEVEVKTSYLKV